MTKRIAVGALFLAATLGLAASLVVIVSPVSQQLGLFLWAASLAATIVGGGLVAWDLNRESKP